MMMAPSVKKKVLFVDDEAILLEMYPLAFESEKDRWEINVAPGGREALALMEEGPMDVLVSDMRMPGMDGAQLLQEVMRRHPRTSRLIMSGYSDSRQVAECLGATHQFLAKPCNLNDLRGTINRVCAVDSLLMDEKLKTLVAQLRSLPSLPSLYFRIMEAVSSPDSSLDEVGKIIAGDPSMTAKILQLVNSAFFGIARQIASPTEAVQYLGVERVRALVLSLHVFSCFERVPIKNFSIEQALQHCMSTGLVAKVLARMQKVERTIADEACVAGMLHDIGKVMLAASLPEQYDQAVKLAREQKLTISDAEREIFGATHSQVGAYLLGLWGLPVTIVEAVAFHHEPRQTSIKIFSPLTAVHAANVLVNEVNGQKATAANAAIDARYLAELGLEGRIEIWRGAAEATLGGVV
jgi:putative nucleotidyltransferase with HDIG domain